MTRHLNVAILSALPVILIVVILALWSYDVWNDRSHSVSVLADTPIYAGHGSEACGGNKLTIVHRGLMLPVLRIRYWKNCATLDVDLPDGRIGYIVIGDGSVSVTPPLSN